ncbi:MAG: HAMP domain-containing histidine kinase [Bacteroidetes bacterium]|nr:HAMP domain-containing histidine kinase [Bacteroidota bacterium]
MRLLQVSLRGSLLFSLMMILVSIPVSFFTIRALLNEEVDESIAAQADQFIQHIQSFEYLDDLETDLKVLDKLSSNIHITPSIGVVHTNYRTLNLYDSVDHENKPFRRFETGVIIKGKPYKLIVRMSLLETNDLVKAIGLVQLAVSVILVLGLLFWNRFLSRRLWKPFYKTLEQLKAYELDKNETVMTEESNITEFNDLNKTVSHLAARNHEVFTQQKEFIENASHELQTPIAIFQSKLDTLMQSPNMTQLEADTIMELESTAQRMAKLNKNLLLLSRIDNEQFLSKEEIELSELIQNQVRILTPFAGPAGIRISTRLEKLTIITNRTLLEVLMTNLLHNAIRHSPRDSDITLELEGSKLHVANTGQGKALDLDKITRRFKKESEDHNSTGLGLAIVRKICDNSHYELSYDFKDAKHVFTVDFQA